jgi:spermidine synthase
MSLALEVVWFRMLVVFLRPTAYAFTVMLACVLGGIALGSAAATPIIARRRPAIIGLAVLQLAAAATAVLSFNTLSRSQETAAAIAPWLHRVGVPDYVGALIAASSLAMLPTTLVLGAAFPVGLALWTSHATSSASRRVGQFYALNVAGAIVGSAGAGFVLLPWLGARGSLIVVSSVPALTSVGLALSVRRTTPNAAGFVATVGPAVFVMCALNAVDPFEVAMQRFHRTERLVWRKEGVQTTVAVHDRPAEPRTIRILYTDGVHQSNDSEGTAFIHQRIGALPVLLHPNPRSALVIGIGGGATPGAVASFGLHVDVVELAQTVVDAAAHFAHINFNLLTRPNVSIRVDDGRNYLLMTDKKYDIVTADAVFPRHAGSASLYSQEYYRLVARALAPGGLVMQWNGGSTEAEYKLLMRSFLSVFPHMTLWGDGTLMLGSLDAFTVSRQAFDARRHQAGFEGTFAWDFDTLARQYVAGPEAIRAFVGDGPVLTDDRPTIEYFLSLPSGDGNATFTGPPGNPGEIVRP